MQTWDCYKGAIQNDEDITLEFDDSQINPATGPIFVSGKL